MMSKKTVVSTVDGQVTRVTTVVTTVVEVETTVSIDKEEVAKRASSDQEKAAAGGSAKEEVAKEASSSEKEEDAKAASSDNYEVAKELIGIAREVRGAASSSKEGCSTDSGEIIGPESFLLAWMISAPCSTVSRLQPHRAAP